LGEYPRLISAIFVRRFSSDSDFNLWEGMKTALRLTVAAFLTATFSLSAASTLYVSLESTNPVGPYATWETAATNIQQAVDAAAAGDTVLVTNGLYAVGYRDVSVLYTYQYPPMLVSIVSRVVVTNSIRVESVNGPVVTTIMGARFTNEVGEVTNGLGCVFLGTNAVLSGFTVTNGYALSGGGVWSESPSAVVSNCTLTGNSGSSCGGGVRRGTLYHCILSGNSSGGGGGAIDSTLYNCTLTGNSASFGGAAAWSTLNHCTLTGNSACDGGGAYCGILNNCTLSSNSAGDGGGVFGDGHSPCVLNHCTLTGNYSAGYGGGAYAFGAIPGDYIPTLNNCTLIGNAAEIWGGAACGYLLVNCTVTGNYAGGEAFGGVVTDCELVNCIVYFNTGGAIFGECGGATLHYCCTPDSSDGGNITNAPLFVDYASGNLHLQSNSPCIDAGTNLTGLISTDILGLPRPMDGNGDGVARFDIGAYEFNPYRFEPTLHLSASGFQFTVCGEPGRSVRIERSRDLLNWEFAGQVPIPIGGQTLIDPAAISESKLFYRAIRVP
jgi:hypothetical protein